MRTSHGWGPVRWRLVTKGRLGGAIYIAMKSESCGRKGQAMVAREAPPPAKRGSPVAR